MLFSSQLFIVVFLPLSLAAFYTFSGRHILKLFALLSASTVFYAWWDPRFLPLLLGSISLNWLLVRLHFRVGANWCLTAGVIVNLALLGLFKYANFFAESVLSLVGVAHDPWSIVLPLGISFFTFQQISYLVDVRRGEAGQYSLLEYACYVSFFPQLIAGPIVRHGELIPQFNTPVWRADHLEMVGRGAVLFSLGLAKKVFFADEIAGIANDGFAIAEAISTMDAWSAAFAFSLQLYFDFSSYSDMAIGLGAMFGFRLPINFDTPYRATDIRVFWRRWHITLSNFLRDYVYIPMGASRGAVMSTMAVVMITMLLCGLWHGAGWTFVAWGALHGAAICCSRLWINVGIRLPSLVAWSVTMITVLVGWVLFRAESFSDAFAILQAMLGSTSITDNLADGDDWTIIGIGMLFAILGPTNVELSKHRLVQTRTVAIVSAILLTLVCLRVGQGRGLEFIYFQF